MDIQIDTDLLKRFLKRCYMNGLVTDLVIQASDGKMFSLISEPSTLFYNEIYETKLKIFKDGLIRVPDLKKLINIINRAEGNIIRILSTGDLFVITDGNGIGKFRAEVFQVSEADTVSTYDAIEANGRRFDKENYTYTSKKLQYNEAVEIQIGSLNTLIKDAHAFACESYNFNIHKTKKQGTFLRCTIENGTTGEKFHRVISNKGHNCNIEDISEATFGNAFKEIIIAISGEKSNDKEDNSKCLMYIIEQAMLITDGKSYFYNLNSVEV